MTQRKLLILPDDTIAPLLQDIYRARSSLKIKLFLFNEPSLMQAVIDAHRRGVQVKVMLNPSRSNGEEANEDSFRKLTEAGVPVKESNPLFKVSHEKSMVVDEQLAYVQSLNWTARHLNDTRDYAVMTAHKKEVAEIIDCFESDWSRTAFNPGETAHLVWCVGNGRARTAHFIDRAKHSLYIQNDRYHDMIIIDRLIKAARRGVKVHVLSPLPHTLKKEKLVEGIGGLRILHDAGIKVHCLKDLALHAKMLLADHQRAMIGSINLTPGSFDERRELAIELDDRELVERLEKTVRHDWHHSKALDLSDRGLLDELEKRGAGGWEKLVLNINGHKLH